MGRVRSDEFTSENLKNYAKACIELGMDMPSYEFDTLLIPSRGAVPVFLGSLYALKYLSKENKIYRNLLDRITAPRTIRKGIFPRAEDKAPEKNDIMVLPYPLTADISLTRCEAGANNDLFSTYIREGAVKTIKSFFKEPHERIEDPYFKFFADILTKIEKRDKLAREYATYPKINNLAMIDTVISGRAATTILQTFGEEGITPQTFLIVDREGQKVRPDFQNQLGYKKFDKLDEHFLYDKRFGKTIKKEINIDRRKIRFYEVNRIMTEDTGCALQGVSATVYPTLILQGNRELFPKGKGTPGLSKVAAGTWHAIPGERNHKMIFYHFINTLKSAINLECARSLCSEDEESVERKQQIFENRRKSLVNILETTRLPEINNDNLGRYYPEYDQSVITDVYESSAQVLHLVFNEGFTKGFIDDFKTEIGIESPKKEQGLEKLL